VQPVEEARLLPALQTYWEEHGSRAEADYAIATSFRNFAGFLMQDKAGVNVTIAQADRALFRRYGDWRMAPHSYSVMWAGKRISHTSKGVKGETLATNLAHIRAAINHQLSEGRILTAPKVHAPDKRLRSPPREYLFTIEEMGAVMAVAMHDKGLFRWLVLQLATCCRPVAALAADPKTQYDPVARLFDLHPKNKARTRKRNPVVPVIEEIHPILMAWAEDTDAKPVASRKRAWRTLRRVLNLPPEAEAKTLRYSVATELRRMGTVPALQIESLLGHEGIKGVTARYAKYDPAFMAEAKAALSNIFQRVAAEAVNWGAVHLLSKPGNSAAKVLARESAKAEDFRAWKGGAAYRTRTCDPRITNARKARRTANPSRKRPERSGDA
jgi:integrase